MSYQMIEIIRLREACRRCRAIAASSEDGFVALSYSQLAEEIDEMIAVREARTDGSDLTF